MEMGERLSDEHLSGWIEYLLLYATSAAKEPNGSFSENGSCSAALQRGFDLLWKAEMASGCLIS